MKKCNNYKVAILDYLKQHSNTDIPRDILINKTNISKSRLSEVLLSLKDDGYNIVTPPRSGIVRLDTNDNQSILPPIKDSAIRQWVIILTLSVYGSMTFKELLLSIMRLRDINFDNINLLTDEDNSNKVYDNTHLIKSIRKNTSSLLGENDIDVAKDIVSVTTLRNDLNHLRNDGLVTLKKNKYTTYELTNNAPLLIPVSAESLYEFCQRYEETASVISEMAPLKQAYLKIKKLINIEGNDIIHHRYGKSNTINQKQIDTFNAFISKPYKTNLLSLKSTYLDKTYSETVAVGLLFYCIETSSFYILGKNTETNKIISRRLDWINCITVLSSTHNEFHHSEYYKIYDEMFSSSYEEQAYRVKVLFEDFGNITRRFTDLKSVRKHATIRPINNPPKNCHYHYVYEDTVRGLTDFARYLRGFGGSVLALEPPELQSKMLFTYNRIIEKYEELHE